MSNVRIEATGDESLAIDITLGGNVRATHSIEAGTAADLAVGGNQKLTISAVVEVVEAGVPTATLEEGVDVSPDLPTEAEDFDINTDTDDGAETAESDEEVGGVIDDRAEVANDEEGEPGKEGESGDDHGFFDIPPVPEAEDEDEKGDPEKEDGSETVTIGPEDVGSIDIFDLPTDAAIQIEQPFLPQPGQPSSPTTEA